jgi:translation elongation factor EF-G
LEYEGKLGEKLEKIPLTKENNQKLYETAINARVALIEQLAELDEQIMELYIDGKRIYCLRI